MALHAAPRPAALGLRLPPRRSASELSLTAATRPLLRCDYSRWGEGTIALEGVSWRAGCLHYSWVKKLDLRGRRKALFALMSLFSYSAGRPPR